MCSLTRRCGCWQYGAVVFWGLDEAEQLFFLRFIQEFEEDAVGTEEQERDDMTFFYAPPSLQVSFALQEVPFVVWSRALLACGRLIDDMTVLFCAGPACCRAR